MLQSAKLEWQEAPAHVQATMKPVLEVKDLQVSYYTDCRARKGTRRRQPDA